MYYEIVNCSRMKGLCRKYKIYVVHSKGAKVFLFGQRLRRKSIDIELRVQHLVSGSNPQI